MVEAVLCVPNCLISDVDRIIKRIMKDHNIDENIASDIFVETCLFLKLSANFPGHKFVPSALVDLGWHTFLLYTKLYNNFCKEVCGSFIHHEPSDNRDVKLRRGGAYKTVLFMKDHGVSFNSRMWPQLEGVLPDDCVADPCKCTGDGD